MGMCFSKEEEKKQIAKEGEGLREVC